MLQNRVREYSTTTGSGTFNLNGRIDATYNDFVSAFGDGNPCFYTIVNMDAFEWEIGHGICHLGTPNTLTRSVVLESSNGGSAVSFSAGVKQVFCGIPQQFFSETAEGGYVPRANADGKITNDWLKNTIGYDYFKVVTYSSSIDIDMENGSKQLITLTGNPTLSLANMSANGDVFTIALKQDGTGGRTVTWFAGITWPGGSPVQPTSTANSITYFDFIRLANGTIYYRQFASAGGGGGGGVDGPVSSNIDAVAVWDDTTGTLLRNSLVNIHSSANDKLEYIASFSTIYALTSGDLTGAHSDQLLATGDTGNNGWTSTGANLWSVTNKLVPGGAPGSGNISKGSGSATIHFDFDQVAYIPDQCTVQLWIGTASSGSTITAKVYQTLPGAVYNQLFHSATTSVPISGGAQLDLAMTADNPYVEGYDIMLALENSFTGTVTIWAIELDLSTTGGVMVIDMNQADKFTWTADASRNFMFDNYSVGQRAIIDITENATGYNTPTFVNCTIKWNGNHNPYFFMPPSSWVETELLCTSIDIYGQPTFKELGRRASTHFDDQNYRIGTVNQDISATTIGLNLDVYLITDSSVTLPSPTADMYGKKITLINSIARDVSNPNGALCTISGTISSNFFNLSGSVYGPSSSWILPGYMDYVTLIAGDPGTLGWLVIDDGRRGIQSGITVVASSTVPPGITYVQCNNSSGITLTLPTPPKYSTLTVNSVNNGTVTVGSTVLKTGQVGVFLYDGSAWRAINVYGSTGIDNVAFKTVSTATYTVVDTDQVLLFTYSSADVAITLSAGSSYTANKKVTLLRGSVSNHDLVISRSGSDTIDGATSKTISGAYTGVTLYNNGSTVWLSDVQGLPSNVTLQGNTFNGNSQLVQLDSSGRLPAIDASLLTNLPAITARHNTQTSSSTYTVLDSDDIVECTHAGNVTLTLSNSSAYTGNKQVTIVNHTSGNTVTIQGSSQNFKDFYVTKTSLILQDGEHITLEWDANASFWVVLNRRFMAYLTGAGSAALGSNCPAVTLTAPYKWVRMTLADESVVYFPVWK